MHYSKSSKHKDALGIDNFEYYKLREVQFRGKDEKYVMLMKIHTDGTYKYPNIRERWYEYYVHHYWIFPKEELNKFATVKDTEKNLIKIEAVHYDYGMGSKSDKELMEQVRLDRLTPKPLYVHIFPFKEKNLVQFLIFGQVNEIASGVVMGPYMRIKRVMNPEVFKKYYYGTKYKTFTKLFNIDPADYADGKAEYKAK